MKLSFSWFQFERQLLRDGRGGSLQKEWRQRMNCVVLLLYLMLLEAVAWLFE